jgi:hypothetical protein
MTKEELEIKKLELEVDKLKQPFFKNPAHLSILVTIILGFSSYYIATDKAKEKQIKELTEQNAILYEKQTSLEKTKVELRADHFQRQFEEFKSKKEEVEQSIQLKEIQFMRLSDKLEEAEREYNDYKIKLNQVQNQYVATKTEYEDYKKRVSIVIDEVADYGPDFAKGLIKSPEGQEKINFIISQNDKGFMKTEIERFAFGISNQAFDQSFARKKIDLRIE